MLSRIVNLLRLPDQPPSDESVFTASWTEFHEASLDKNPDFRTLVVDIQQEIMLAVERYGAEKSNLKVLEIGSGVIPMSKLYVNVISTDLNFSSNVDLIMSAYDPPFATSSFSAVVAQNVFHHLSDYKVALTEISNLLEEEGLIVLVEPYYKLLSRLIYPVLFASEDFDINGIRGSSDRSAKPNQALSAIVFERDLSQFESDFPNLQVVELLPMQSGIRYLSVGGLNFRRLVPRSVIRLLRKLEHSKFRSILIGPLSLHWMIILRKTVPEGDRAYD